MWTFTNFNLIILDMYKAWPALLPMPSWVITLLMCYDDWFWYILSFCIMRKFGVTPAVIHPRLKCQVFFSVSAKGQTANPHYHHIRNILADTQTWAGVWLGDVIHFLHHSVQNTKNQWIWSRSYCAPQVQQKCVFSEHVYVCFLCVSLPVPSVYASVH